MKKNVFLFGIVLFIVFGCKKAVDNKNDSKIEAKKEITSLTDCNLELAKRLKQSNTLLCDSPGYIPAVAAFHMVSNENYIHYLENYWGNTSSIVYQKISWARINKDINNLCYQKYLMFTGNYSLQNNSDIDYVLVDDFDCKKTCYSIPLFKSLQQLNMTLSSDLFFTKAKLDNGKSIIIFKTSENATVGYFDISEDPKMVQLLFDFINIKLKK
jgi:hypothetical protein